MMVTKILLGIFSVVSFFFGILFWGTDTPGEAFIGFSIVFLILIIFMEKIAVAILYHF